MESSQPHQATYLGAALDAVDEQYDRIIVITDEQSHDRVGAPRGKGYMINVASARNGVGYGPWVHIDGFSEAIVNYIRELEYIGARTNNAKRAGDTTPALPSLPDRFASNKLTPA